LLVELTAVAVELTQVLVVEALEVMEALQHVAK
jgi:hypothetical protein